MDPDDIDTPIALVEHAFSFMPTDPGVGPRSSLRRCWRRIWRPRLDGLFSRLPCCHPTRAYDDATREKPREQHRLHVQHRGFVHQSVHPYQFAVPLSTTGCVPAPSCTTIVAFFAPVVFDARGATPGASVTLIVQLAPIAMVEVQLLV